MNDSNLNNNNNNNIFGTPNNINNIPTTPEQPINNIANNINSIPEINNNNVQPQSNATVNTNAVNSTSDFNSVFGINNASNSIPNEVSQPIQNLNNGISSQPNTISQINNNNINSTTEINNNHNQQNSISVSPILNQNVVNQPQMQPNQITNNNVSSQQNFNNNSVSNEELLKAFIGNNYEKITTKPFNFAGFFFTTFYMFYRKMFGYALLVFLLLNIINKFIVIIAFNIVVGLLVNKVYLFYANKKISKIKLENPNKDINELKNICSSKGGTSVGKIFLGFITELAIGFVILFIMIIIGIGSTFGKLFNLDNWNIILNHGSNSSSLTSGTLVENVVVGDHSCFNSKCNVTIYDSNDNSSDYALSVNNSDLFNSLSDYADYIKLNIYYTQKANAKTIVGYKIYLKSNNDDISSVKNENELRDKIGLYSIGTHTASFTLSKIGETGFGFKDDKSYTYTNYTFVDSKNIEYEMKYINSNGTLNLVQGIKYNVTFEVVEDIFEYDFIIKSVK